MHPGTLGKAAYSMLLRKSFLWPDGRVCISTPTIASARSELGRLIAVTTAPKDAWIPVSRDPY